MTAPDAEALLGVLRTAAGAPGLAFAEAPVRLAGGLDTGVFAFRLRGAPPALAGPLVLRILGGHHDPRRVLRERAVQDAVAAQGYPAPRCVHASTDAGPLGGPFLVMERRPGRPLLAVRATGLGGILVDMQARLHALDPRPLLEAVGAAGLDPASMTLAGHLAQLAARIRRHGLEGLAPAMAWLAAQRPPAATAVICHGDFHPQNLLAEGKRVTGVVDWPNCVVADPAFDIASTRLILECTPLDLVDVPAPLRWAMGAARRILVRRYLAGWRRRGGPDAARLAYHEAAAAMRSLVLAAETRAGATGRPAGALERSAFPERIAARFAAVSGVTPRLPAPPAA